MIKTLVCCYKGNNWIFLSIYLYFVPKIHTVNNGLKLWQSKNIASRSASHKANITWLLGMTSSKHCDWKQLLENQVTETGEVSGCCNLKEHLAQVVKREWSSGLGNFGEAILCSILYFTCDCRALKTRAHTSSMKSKWHATTTKKGKQRESSPELSTTKIIYFYLITLSFV